MGVRKYTLTSLEEVLVTMAKYLLLAHFGVVAAVVDLRAV
jgi:hypothetical protein